MIQKLLRAWGSDPAPIEAMSASMALAFLLIFLAGQTFPGLVQPGDPFINRAVWILLCAAASLPYFVGWVWDKQGVRNIGLFCGATFWALVAANFAVVGDARAITWGIYGGFVGWAFLRRRRSHVQRL